jgi:hypothetical protein
MTTRGAGVTQRAIVWPLVVAACSFVMVATPLSAAAQQAAAFAPRQFVLSGGGSITDGYPLGDRTITIPRNSPGAATPFTMLRAESQLARFAGVEGRIGFVVNRSFALEVGGAYAKPELAVTISEDPELAGGAVASERVDQFVIDVSGIYHWPVSLGRRARPYAIGGGGYLRQLHEGRLLVETGRTFHVGGGLHYWLRGVPRGRALGVRAEARYMRRTGGVDFEDRARGTTSVSALAFVAF